MLVGLKPDPCGQELGLSRPIHEGDNGLPSPFRVMMSMYPIFWNV